MPGIQLTVTPAKSQAGTLNENSDWGSKRKAVVVQEQPGFSIRTNPFIQRCRVS